MKNYSVYIPADQLDSLPSEARDYYMRFLGDYSTEALQSALSPRYQELHEISLRYLSRVTPSPNLCVSDWWRGIRDRHLGDPPNLSVASDPIEYMFGYYSREAELYPLALGFVELCDSDPQDFIKIRDNVEAHGLEDPCRISNQQNELRQTVTLSNGIS